MSILPLARATHVENVGGKAANLARLLAAGAPVPDGFVIASAALHHFIAEQEAQPLEIDLRVIEAWRPFSNGPVIVRSSAVGEDSADASFAGQLDSVPNVTSAGGLRQAILHVWSSQWSPRALAYQAARGTFLRGMGIVVQRQVDARTSGVLFTQSPASRGDMLLEYCEGLGEALVSGAVDPGRVTVDRASLAATALADCPGARLSGEQITALARLALSIERAFGAPQDIEWTIGADDRIWIVQSRPITSLGPGVRGSGGPEVLWSNANVNENFPQPISPLLYSIARAGYYHYFRNLGRAFGISRRRLAGMEPSLRQIIGVHGARMYYNLTSIHDILRSAPFGDHLAAYFNQFVGAEDSRSEHSRSFAGSVSAPKALLEAGAIAASTIWQYRSLTSRVEAFERTADAFAAATRPARLAVAPQQALVESLRGFMEIRCHRWKNASLADAASMVCYGLLQRLLARAFPAADQQALHNTLLKALPGLVSSMPAAALWELSRQIRADAGLRALFRTASAPEILQTLGDDRFASFRKAFDRYLEDWGFRCSAELMLTAPSFQEDPTPAIDLLKSYAAMEGESPAAQLARQARARERETARVLAVLRRRPVSRWIPFLRQSLVVGTILGWTQRSIQLRERARLKQALLYSRLRRVVLALGERLAAQGRLSAADDVFFLSVEELDLLASGGEMFPDHARELAALRRRAHAEVSSAKPPDSLRLPPGGYLRAGAVTAAEAAAADGPHLSGLAACGGSSTARAAILVDVTESGRLQAGDILVTRQTDPGWGPIFPLISGLVIERGGMLSHGAIIAREFGIPSVVGVKDATRLIAHGASITVDGNRGLVHVGAGDTR